MTRTKRKKQPMMKVHLDREAVKERDKLKKVVTSIAEMTRGIHVDWIDWANVGKMAVSEAREAIRPKCKTCGK